MQQHIYLGTFDLRGKVTSEIKPSGGFWKIKQDNGISLAAGSKKDAVNGGKISFTVTFDNDLEASQFVAYCEPYSPENATEDTDLALYLRDSLWHYSVASVDVRASNVNDTSQDYIHYSYDVICNLNSPYSSKNPSTVTLMGLAGLQMDELAVTPSGTKYGLLDGEIYEFGTSWDIVDPQPPYELTTISANDTYLLGLTATGTVYQFDGIAWTLMFGGLSGIIDISIAANGSIFVIKPDQHLYLWTGSTFINCNSTHVKKCSAMSAIQCWTIGVTNNRAYRCRDFSPWYEDGPKGTTTLLDISCGSVITKVRAVSTANDAVWWNDSILAWVSLSKAVKSVSARITTSWWLDTGGYLWEFDGDWIYQGEALDTSYHIDNTEGHLNGSPDVAIVAEYTIDHVESITLDLNDETLTLADYANSSEVWDYQGSEKKIIETYEDTITSDAKFSQDWTSPLGYEYNAGIPIINLYQYSGAYILLSGPNKVSSPIVMTADISIEYDGYYMGNENDAYVQMSSDAVNWVTIFDHHAFENGVAAYGIPAMGMTDVYIRIYNDSVGHLYIKYIKFEVERKAPMLSVPPGAEKALTISSFGGSSTPLISFSPKRMR